MQGKRPVYKKWGNVFFRSDQQKLLQEVKASEKDLRARKDAAQMALDSMVDKVMNERARKILSASASDDLWKDFGAGEQVQVHGLQKAPQYNGKIGVIERWEGDRFVVNLEGKGKGVKIKPENLKPLRSTESDASAGSQDKVGQDGVGHQAFTGLVRER